MALRTFRTAAFPAVLAAAIVLPVPYPGQTPRTNVKASEFRKLQWIAGDWIGSGGEYPAFYERYAFVNDSTIEQQSFSDETMRTVTDRATIALRNGRIIHASGSSRSDAVALDATGISFVAAKPGGGAFVFKRASKGRWLATLRSATGKRTIYEMRPKR